MWFDVVLSFLGHEAMLRKLRGTSTVAYPVLFEDAVPIVLC